MKERDLSGYTSHDHVWLLLPWYVNETLEQEERDCVDAHVRVCITCRGELRRLDLVRNAVRHAATLEPSSKRAFAGLMHHIESERERGTPKAVAVSSSARPARGGWRRLLRGRLAGWIPRLPVMTAAAVMLLALAMLPALVGMLQVPDKPAKPSYRTLAASRGGSTAGPNDIRVVFSENVGRSQRQRLAHSIGGVIIEGPDRQGVFLIRLTRPPASAIDADRTLNALRQRDEILFAEPAMSPVLAAGS